MNARIPAFGVGCAKSGTHSLAAMFERSIRAAHEPEHEMLMHLILRVARKEMSVAAFDAAAARLLAEMNLDLNVSQINGFIIGALFRLFPDARHILTVRDARSWLKSFVNYQLTMEPLLPNSAWYTFRQMRFRPRMNPHSPQDEPLKKLGLFSLDAYLGYWQRHNALVIATIPPSQLLIVPMRALSKEAGRVEAFLGLPPGTANLEKAHDHPGDYVPSPLDRLDQAYLDEHLAFYNGKLLEAVAAHAPPTSVSALKAAIGEGEAAKAAR